MDPKNCSTNQGEAPPIYTVNSGSEDLTQRKISGDVESNLKSDTKDVSSWTPPTVRPPFFSSRSVSEKMGFLAATITVEPMLFLFVFSLALCMVTTQSLVIRKYCLLELNLSDEHCRNLTHDKPNEAKAQELASTLNMYKALLEAVPTVVLALFLGAWSDKYGRKMLLLLPNIGTCLQLVLLVVYAVYETELEPLYLLVTVVPLALCGGMMPVMVGSAAYISDTSTPESRVLRLAVMQSFFLVGAPLGSVTGGAILTHFGYVTVYVVAAVMSLLCIIYVIFVLKETVKKPDGPSQPIKDFFDLTRVRQGLDTCFRKRENNHRLHLLLLMLAMSMNFFPVMGEMSVAYLYTRKKFEWTEIMYSYYASSSLLASMVGLLIALPIMKVALHLSDVAIASIGAACRICSETMIAFAPQGWFLFAVCPFMVFAGMYSPILRGMLSQIVSREEQGKLYSVVGACEAAMPVLGIVLYTKVYNATSTSFPGAVFLMSAIVFIIPTIIFIWLQRDMTKRTNAAKLKEANNGESPM